MMTGQLENNTAVRLDRLAEFLAKKGMDEITLSQIVSHRVIIEN